MQNVVFINYTRIYFVSILYHLSMRTLANPITAALKRTLHELLKRGSQEADYSSGPCHSHQKLPKGCWDFKFLSNCAGGKSWPQPPASCLHHDSLTPLRSTWMDVHMRSAQAHCPRTLIVLRFRQLCEKRSKKLRPEPQGD